MNKIISRKSKERYQVGCLKYHFQSIIQINPNQGIHYFRYSSTSFRVSNWNPMGIIKGRISSILPFYGCQLKQLKTKNMSVQWQVWSEWEKWRAVCQSFSMKSYVCVYSEKWIVCGVISKKHPAECQVKSGSTVEKCFNKRGVGNDIEKREKSKPFWNKSSL